MEDVERTDNDAPDSGTRMEMDRRDFLKIAGGGIVLFFTLGDLTAFAQHRGTVPTDFNAFLRIAESGRVSCYTGKIEMGQGIITSLAQMLADEIDVPLESVQMVMGDTDLCPWDAGTWGSLSTRSFGPKLRAAGAEARMMLLELASQRLNVAVADLSVERGIVYDKANRARRVSYGELAKGAMIQRHASGSVPVKKFSEFTIVNRPHLRRDGSEKVTGMATYAADVSLPGMLYAKILRPPSHASKLLRVDLSIARAMKDVVVVHDGDFIAVLHRYPDVAEQALATITATYDTPATTINDATIFDHLVSVSPEGRIAAANGDVKKGAAESAVRVDSTYYDGYCAHAAIEPHAAVVMIEGGKATVWASTQTPYPCREDVAKELGFALENVRVITPYVGGGFGGKTVNPQAVEAARLAKRTGKPVQVAFTRKEEFFYDAFHAAAVIKLSSGLDGAGMLHYWDYRVYCAGDRGAKHFYTIPNSSTTVYGANTAAGRRSHQFATGPWRAPGNNTNTFARESQMDIMAEKAGSDAVTFRLKHLSQNTKMYNVLKLAADTFGWTAPTASDRRGFGVACGEDAGTLVAMIAEVEVNASTGAVRVKRVVCAQDMGLIVNPEGAVIQMEGCITMGLGYALSEQIRFTGGQILDENFDTYEIPRFSWLPKIETAFVVDNEAAPQGGGEPAIITVGAAIANAVCDATGARVFRLPITPQRIKDALKK